jgi:UDP-N-acetyl-D-mannosaminuronate dehydrogenase
VPEPATPEGPDVVVVGQGYVGLPVALRAARVGRRVLGFDLDKDRVDKLRRGESFVDDVTDADLRTVIADGRFRAGDDAAELAGFSTAVVCVPTPLRDGAPDLGHIESAARLLAPHVTRARPRRCSPRSWRRVPACVRGRTSTSATAPNASTRRTPGSGW